MSTHTLSMSSRKISVPEAEEVDNIFDNQPNEEEKAEGRYSLNDKDDDVRSKSSISSHRTDGDDYDIHKTAKRRIKDTYERWGGKEEAKLRAAIFVSFLYKPRQSLRLDRDDVPDL